MKKENRIISLNFLAILFCCFLFCNCTVEKKENLKVERSYNAEINTIMNVCIQELTPKEIIIWKRNLLPKGTEMNLYVSEKHYNLSKESIKEFIKLGASPLLQSTVLDKNQDSRVFSADLKRFDNIIVSSMPPIKRKEVKENVGGINFSVIVLNKKFTKAACIFDYSYWQQIETNHYYAVELEKDKNWRITSKIRLEKTVDHLLIDNYNRMRYYSTSF